MRFSIARYIWILLLTVCLIPNSSKAVHQIGGEITWKCLPSGEYQFFAKVYRDCSGISWPFINETIQIVGNPLPSSSLGGPAISTIILKPDSAVWLANNLGDISPRPVGAPSALTISCANGDYGSVQEFSYFSDPIRLYGTPPASGWQFWITSLPCCRANLSNLASSGSPMLRAEMYPSSNTTTAGHCYDSSPQFLASPQYAFCRGSVSTTQDAAFDPENDSLVFEFDRTYNQPPSAPQVVPYRAGYSFDNPLPDNAFNMNNMPAQLESRSGLMKFALFSGSPLTQKFHIVSEVAAYRSGRLLAKIYRELPYFMFDCPTLPNNTINLKPDLSISNGSSGIEINVVAGEIVSLPINIIDTDSSANGPQNIRLTTKGRNFATDYVDSSLCDNPPCAVFLGNQMIYDSSRQEYAIDNLAQINTTFKWQTSCNHLGANGEKQTYRFYLKAEDDHPPIPKVENGYIIVNVYPQEADPPANFCGSLSGNDLAMNWTKTGIDSSAFVSWRVYKRIGGNSFRLIDTIANYQITSYLDQNHNPAVVSSYLIRPVHNVCGTNREGRASEVFFNTYLNAPQVFANGSTLTTTTNGEYQWYSCDSSKVISNQDSSSFTPLISGNYALILNRGGCRDTSNCFLVFAVGLEENSVFNGLSLFPNPTNGLVFIEGIDQSLDYQIFNIQGKLMKRGRLAADQNQLELPEAEGLYFVSFRDAEGNEKTFKLVKQ
jgi:hypothetical protein